MIRALPLFAVLATLLVYGAARAQDTSPGDIHQTEAALQKTQDQEKKLAQRMQGLKGDLGKTQKTLLALADDIRDNEQSLSVLERRIAKNKAEQQEIESRLADDQESLSRLILAMKRMNDIPPEVIILKPGAPLDTAQGALLLESVLPRLNRRAEGLKTDLTRLDILTSALEKDLRSATKAGAALKDQQTEMSALLSTREKSYRETTDDYRTQVAESKRLAAEARSLRELMGRIEENRRKKQVDVPPSVSAAPLSTRPAALPAMGAGRLPASGHIRVAYGETDDIGAQAQGMTLEVRPGALVVSPLGGVIRYTGEFMNYGPMVIVEHQKDYHSLIAGLGRIDTVVGQSVAAGEPVGRMGNSGTPSLYYELRRNGQPVDPGRTLKF
jgi:septal ring factor EnvC (AmiA/AmiB activator)